VARKEHRGLLSIRYPMEHGIIRDWNDMERIWQYIFSKEQLRTVSEEVTLSPRSHAPCVGEIFVPVYYSV